MVFAVPRFTVIDVVFVWRPIRENVGHLLKMLLDAQDRAHINPVRFNIAEKFH